MLTSQGLVLATAMAVSAGTMILFDHFREKHSLMAENRALKSCLTSSSGIKNKNKKKKKEKRVSFAEDVKDSKGNGELYRKKQRNSSCGNELKSKKKMMPQNHVALYSGILKNRVQMMNYSY